MKVKSMLSKNITNNQDQTFCMVVAMEKCEHLNAVPTWTCEKLPFFTVTNDKNK